MSRPGQVKRSAARKAEAGPRAQKSRGAGRQARPRSKPATRSSSERATKKWSAAVTLGSNALDLEPSVFAKSSARAIAQSLKRSAEQSRRRKAPPFQSAMSMLSFYINRAGRNLPKTRLQILERAKGELRKAFGRR